MKLPEILSPAGDTLSFEAALSAGADAVYLGGPKYSARAYASNFSEKDLEELIKKAHENKMKVYVAVNTLLKDSEIYDALLYTERLWSMGVDAVIIQDTGLIYLAGKYIPELELHASTQMTVHNYAGTALMEKMGIRRTVLSRELSLEEIKEISKDFETEVFIQGALCISYSGKCLMSSMIGGRSGNRGRCAQSCRMSYDLLDSRNSVKKSGFLLSPKDLNTLDIIGEIKDTGTSSLKIEGRMKRPEYVYYAVKQYKDALLGKDYSKENLLQIFNREGSTLAFLKKDEGRNMMAVNSPKNTGRILGKAGSDGVRLKTEISLGDGIRFGEEGFIATKITVGGKTVKSAREGERAVIYPRNYKPGDVLYKTSDASLMKEISKAIEKGPVTTSQNEEPEEEITVDISGVFKPGLPFELRGEYKGRIFTSEGDIVEQSIKSPVTYEKLKTNLLKTGDFSFKLKNVDIGIQDGFLPVSSINMTRRNLYNSIEEYIQSENAGFKDKNKDKDKNNTSVNPADKPGENSCETKDSGRNISGMDSLIPSRKDVLGILNNLSTGNNGKDEKSKYSQEDNNKYNSIKENENNAVDNVLPKYLVTVSRHEQLKAVMDMDRRDIMVAVNPVMRQKGSVTIADLKRMDSEGYFKKGYWVKCPEILKSEFKPFMEFLYSLKNVRGVLTSNYGVINELKKPRWKDKNLTVTGDYKINIFNSFSEIPLDIDGSFMSEELNLRELKEIENKDDKYILLFGRQEYMISEYCPIGAFCGGKDGNHACSAPCMKEDFYLKDRMGEEYPVLTDIYCRSYIMGPDPKDITGEAEDLRNLGYSHFAVNLTDENHKETINILSSITKGEGVEKDPRYQGHFKRGVE